MANPRSSSQPIPSVSIQQQTHLSRRGFLTRSGALAASSLALPLSALRSFAQAPAPPPPHSLPHLLDNPRMLQTWNAALSTLAGNVKLSPNFHGPILLEGAVYPGIWQE